MVSARQLILFLEVVYLDVLPNFGEISMGSKVALTLFAVLFLLSNGAAAKGIEMGTAEISGDLNLELNSSSSTRDVDGNKSDFNRTSVSVFALRYAAPDIGVGMSWRYFADKYSEEGYSENRSTYAIGPAVALNVDINPQVSIKLIGEIGFVSSSYDDSDGFTYDGDGIFWAGSARFSYFVSNDVSIDATAKYTSSSLDYIDYTVDTTAFTTGVGLSVYLQ